MRFILSSIVALQLLFISCLFAEEKDSLGNLSEPSALLPAISERAKQKDSLFPSSPLTSLHENTSRSKEKLYNDTGFKWGFALTHVFQGVTDSLSGTDDTAAATTSDILGMYELIDKGMPTAGKIVAHGQARWDYGSSGPEDLGSTSLGSVIGTADTFSAYSPTVILRNLYWRQGSKEAGWVYQFGKITPDGIVNSSPYLASETTFLPSGGTGPFAIALPDSGLGALAAWFLNDRVTIGGLVSDANADRFDFGDLDEGDLFYAAEIHAKLFPKTKDAPYSKFTVWHTDGTKNRQPANGSLGPSGWGFYMTHHQEMTRDGRAIGIIRYGKSYDDSAIYEEQASAHFILKNPKFITRLNNDMLGLALNWASVPFDGARDEYNVEAFYRFPIFPHVDTTISYQSVINPALQRDFDHASVFSLRLRTTF